MYGILNVYIKYMYHNTDNTQLNVGEMFEYTHTLIPWDNNTLESYHWASLTLKNLRSKGPRASSSCDDQRVGTLREAAIDTELDGSLPGYTPSPLVFWFRGSDGCSPKRCSL